MFFTYLHLCQGLDNSLVSLLLWKQRAEEGKFLFIGLALVWCHTDMLFIFLFSIILTLALALALILVFILLFFTIIFTFLLVTVFTPPSCFFFSSSSSSLDWLPVSLLSSRLLFPLGELTFLKVNSWPDLDHLNQCFQYACKWFS